MEELKSKQIKPCPFCGSDWIERYCYATDIGNMWNIYCAKCKATFRGKYEDEVINRWNQRVEQA